jgi:hypothetical protein
MKISYYRIVTSIVLIAVGLLIWLSNLGILHIAWQRDWPAILIALGVIELIKHLFRRRIRQG